MNTFVKLMLKVIVLFLFISCIFLSIIFIPDFIKSYKIKWHETTGTVLSSYVKVVKKQKGTSYCPKIKYQYHVSGVKYEAESTYKKLGCKLTHKSAEKVLKKYAVGDVIKIYYSNHLDNSVLDKRITWADYLLIILLPFLSILFLYILFSKQAMENIYLIYGKKRNDS